MSETRNHIFQAIQDAKDGNPNEMQDSLAAALTDKITDAINLKKIALAGEFFGEKNDEDEEDENGEENGENGEDNGKNGKKKKKNPFAKKNGDDDDEDEDEEDEE